MGSKPKKQKESEDSKLQRYRDLQTAKRGERLMSAAMPEQARLAGKKFRDVAAGRANANVSQGLGNMRMVTDPSRGDAAGLVGNRAIGRKQGLTRALDSAFNRALGVEDTLKSNVISSGTETSAATSAGLSSLAGTAEAEGLSKLNANSLKRETNWGAGNALINAGAGAYSYRKGLSDYNTRAAEEKRKGDPLFSGGVGVGP